VEESERFRRWAISMKGLLTELASQATPYPFDTNELRSPVSTSAVVPEALWPLYAVCDGANLPDVWNGYFIDAADELALNKKRGLPTQIAGTPPLEIEVFGSDGGGGSFAVAADGAVYYLPSWGVVENNVYTGDETRGARRISGSVIGFLQRLLADVEAFVHQRDGHVYIESEFTTYKP
jgi:hypothetical protein